MSVNFPRGSNSKTKLRYTVDLIKDIEYEQEKHFSLTLSNVNTERLTIEPQRTIIVIRDYNGKRDV